MFYCFNSEIVTNMKLIRLDMFETVASGANVFIMIEHTISYS